MIRLVTAFFKREVKKKLKPRLLKHLLEACSFAPKELWGKQKPPGFEELMILCTFYKDLFTKSYDDIVMEINKKLVLAKKSLEHKIHAC